MGKKTKSSIAERNPKRKKDSHAQNELRLKKKKKG